MSTSIRADKEQTKILILGAGAVGLSLAALLHEHAIVHAVCREKHITPIRERGCILEGIWGEKSIFFSCSMTADEMPDPDIIVLTAKSTETKEIAEQFREIITGKPIITLQNGIGNEEILLEYTPYVYGGNIITGFEWIDNGHIRVSVEGGPMWVGVYPTGPVDALLTRWHEIISECGIPISLTTDIRSEIWAKSLYNACLNPLGAINKVSYGDLQSPHALAIISEIISEFYAVMEAEGITLRWESPETYFSHLCNTLIPATADHHSSMYQDLAIGRKTEIDFLNGAIMRIGAKHGMKTPVNACMTELIRCRE